MTTDYTATVNCPCCNHEVVCPMIVCDNSFGVRCTGCGKWLRGEAKVKVEYKVWEEKIN